MSIGNGTNVNRHIDVDAMMKNKRYRINIVPTVSTIFTKRFIPIDVRHDGLGSEIGGRNVVTGTDDIWDKDFGDIIVDREKTKRFSYRYRGSMRMAMGLFFSNNEYDCWRNAVLSKKLP